MKNQKRKGKIVPIIFAIIILGGISSLFSDDEPEKEDTPVSEVAVESIVTESSESDVASESSVSSEESKEPELTIEEKSKQWVAETLANHDLKETVALFHELEDEELKEKISLGNRKGTQWSDDFDIVGERVIVNGIVGRKKDATRTSYEVYIGDMDFSTYDSYFDFLKANPDEEKNSVYVTFNGKENVLEWQVGEQVTFSGAISSFPNFATEYINISNAEPVE